MFKSAQILLSFTLLVGLTLADVESQPSLSDEDLEELGQLNTMFITAVHEFSMEMLKNKLEHPEEAAALYKAFGSMPDSERNYILSAPIEYASDKWMNIAVQKLENSDLTDNEKDEMHKNIVSFFTTVEENFKLFINKLTDFTMSPTFQKPTNFLRHVKLHKK